MTVKKYINITVSIVALCVVLFIVFKYCGDIKTYNQQEVDAMNAAADSTKQAFIDSLTFVRGQLDLQQERASAQQQRADSLGKQIDALISKHDITKKKMSADFTNTDTGFVLAPNEYVTECENCFTLLGNYKKESAQLKFERDSYDTLMKKQMQISDDRINELVNERVTFNKLLNDCRIARAYAPACDTTRKVKFSLIGMFSDPFLPRGGGGGFIYEDKRFNEYGAHVVFTNKGNIYLFNIAKTISFRSKK